MKSPFPGKDPYIESCGLWDDFYNHLVERISDALAGALPARYLVKTGKRVYSVFFKEDSEATDYVKPDVSVSARESDSVADEGPVEVRSLFDNTYIEKFVEIVENGVERRLVTCIEVLSPSNKREGSVGRFQYVRKRQSILLGRASLVEIDLLRGGERMPMLDPWPDSPYTLLVSRRIRTPYCRVFKGYSLRPLPAISVPLDDPDPDVTLELQPLVDAIYTRYQYCSQIDYRKAPGPALTEEETSWLRERLPTAPDETA